MDRVAAVGDEPLHRALGLTDDELGLLAGLEPARKREREEEAA